MRRVILCAAMTLGLAACAPVSPSEGPAAVTPTAPPPSAIPSAHGTPPVVGSGAAVHVALSPILLPTARSRAVAFTFDSAILVCGGLINDGATTASIVRIDTATARVSSSFGALSVPVHDAGGAILNGVGYIVGGGRQVATTEVAQVDATGSGGRIGDLPAARADLAVVTVGSVLLVVGGGTPSAPDVRVLATSDGHRFRTIARLLVGVRYPAVATLGGLVYVVGGATRTADSRAIQEIDPRTGKVRLLGQLPHGLSHAAAFVLDGRIFIAGGRTSGRVQDTLWRLDVATGTVVRVGRLPYPVSDMAVAVSGGVAYLIGGEGHAPLDTIVTVAVGP